VGVGRDDGVRRVVHDGLQGVPGIPDLFEETYSLNRVGRLGGEQVEEVLFLAGELGSHSVAGA
jgi:hypothetical protein